MRLPSVRRLIGASRFGFPCPWCSLHGDPHQHDAGRLGQVSVRSVSLVQYAAAAVFDHFSAARTAYEARLDLTCLVV
jgi:hypothetical protein